jgi:ABC-type bacteriocin/lantibiotic exporter with double-glycine peptidase domain
MSGAASAASDRAPPGRLTLEPQQWFPLGRGRMITLTQGAADLFLALPGSDVRRFVAHLPEGAMLPLPPEVPVRFSIRATGPAILTEGGSDEGAALCIAALSGTEGDTPPPTPIASPEAFASHCNLLLASAAARLAAQGSEAHDALNEQAAAQAEDFKSSLGDFNLLLADRFRRPGEGAPPSPLAAAAIRVAEGLRIKPVPVNEERGEDRNAFLKRFAAAHRMRLRRIHLDLGEPPEGEGPLLAFGTGGRPLVLTPAWRGGYTIEDVDAGTTRGLSGGDWAALEPDLLAFHPTLPEGKLTYLGLMRFALGLTLHDIGLFGFCAVIGALLALVPPLASAEIADVGLYNSDVQFLLGIIGVLLGFLVAQTVFFVIGQLAQARLHGKAGLALHAAMVDRLLRLPPQALRGSTSILLATQTETVEKFCLSMVSFVSTAVLAVTHGLVASAIIAVTSPASALVALGMVAGLAALAGLIGWAQFKAIYEGERMDVVVMSFAYDVIRLLPTIRAFRAEQRIFTQWSQNFLAFQARMMRSSRITNAFAVFESLWDILVLAMCFAALAIAGAAGLGASDAIVFVLALGRLTHAGREMSAALIGAAKLMPMGKLARPLIELTVEPLPSGRRAPAVSGAIEIADLGFFYGSRAVLDRVSLSVADGEFVGLIGPSGSGKSTLLRLIMGLEKPRSGRISIGGHDISRLERHQIAHHIGAVLQDSRLIPGTIFENIRGATEIGTDEAWAFADLAGVAEDLRRLPMGMRTLVGESTSLSDGQVRRLLIARALAQRPKVLILDEALAALDRPAQTELLNTLRGLDMTRILVAHRGAALTCADRIVAIEKGRIVDDGPPAEVLARQSYLTAPTPQEAS